MSANEHKVLKTLTDYEVKKILSDHMKSLSYKALCGCGGDINMHFKRLKESVSVDGVEFEVQDHNNPELETVWIKKAEAHEILAKVKKLNPNTHVIKID